MADTIINPMYCKNDEDSKPNYNKFLVTYVVKNIDEEDSAAFKSYCNNNKISFTIREYSSLEYEEDRDYIAKLPAYHIFYNNEYMDTSYSDPLVTIEEIMKKVNKPSKIITFLKKIAKRLF